MTDADDNDDHDNGDDHDDNDNGHAAAANVLMTVAILMLIKI